jgi:hypothetical protein
MREPKIYLQLMQEALERLSAGEAYLALYKADRQRFDLESAALQLRKAMEAIAFAAIAPNKQLYAEFRKNASKPAKFGDDWQADSIFLNLSKINPDFYPDPLLPQKQTGANSWHFDRLSDGFMTRARFETLYKRLGKFLHADNPWGADKGWGNFAKDLPGAVDRMRTLLRKHRTVIRTTEFSGVWVVDAPSDGSPPRMFLAMAIDQGTAPDAR